MDTRNDLESKYSTVSRRETPLFVLARQVDPKRAENFLNELANLRSQDSDAVKRFTRRFKEFCPGHFPRPSGTPSVRDELVIAWKEPTTRDREAWLFNALADALHFGLSGNNDQPQDRQKWTNICAAIWQGAKVADRMRVCGNPECPAPYFIARKRSHKYCSQACAAPAIRELKRTWWKEHGREWTEARKKPSRVQKSKGRKQR
jgi:hypothetical protein